MKEAKLSSSYTNTRIYIIIAHRLDAPGCTQSPFTPCRSAGSPQALMEAACRSGPWAVLEGPLVSLGWGQSEATWTCSWGTLSLSITAALSPSAKPQCAVPSVTLQVKENQSHRAKSSKITWESNAGVLVIFKSNSRLSLPSVLFFSQT